jgi:hypothetical protein
MPFPAHAWVVDAIELDVDPDDDELIGALSDVVAGLALERHDLADPLTAIEADQRIGFELADASIEYEPAHLLEPPVWRIRRDTND